MFLSVHVSFSMVKVVEIQWQICKRKQTLVLYVKEKYLRPYNTTWTRLLRVWFTLNVRRISISSWAFYCKQNTKAILFFQFLMNTVFLKADILQTFTQWHFKIKLYQYNPIDSAVYKVICYISVIYKNPRAHHCSYSV